MGKYARLSAAILAIGMTGFGYQQPGLLSCEGRFGQFGSNGFLVAMPSRLSFVVDWLTPAISTDTGTLGRITALTPIELAFEIQYESYRANYRVSRIDGTISERSNFGGVFYGTCDLRSLETKF
jgi:hypothetical protein